MFRSLFLVGAFSIVSSVGFAASDWKVVATSNEHVYGVDLNSIAKVSEYPYQKYHKAWVKSVIVNDLTKDGMTVGDYNMILEWVDCSSRTLGNKSQISYKQNGTVIPNAGRSMGYVKMEDVIPGTIGESILDAICN